MEINLIFGCLAKDPSIIENKFSIEIILHIFVYFENVAEIRSAAKFTILLFFNYFFFFFYWCFNILSIIVWRLVQYIFHFKFLLLHCFIV